MKKIFNLLPFFMKKVIINNGYIFLWREYLLAKKKLDKQLSTFFYDVKNKKGIQIKNDSQIWVRAFKKYIKAEPKYYEVATSFFDNDIKLVHKVKQQLRVDEIISIVVLKNDLMKIKEFVNHHRNLGVSRFAILDNDSNDGTLEWLLQQKDIDVFSSEKKYTTDRRQGWINRIIAYYGINRWYLVLDSDELFSFKENFENIHDYIDFLSKEKLNSSRAIMVDLYAKNDYYDSFNDDNYMNELLYFDRVKYSMEKTVRCNAITGGMRERVFNIEPFLNKIPLFKIKEGELSANSHYQYPFFLNHEGNTDSIIFHYKFLPSDLAKYNERASDGNFALGSKEYLSYLSVLENKVNYWNSIVSETKMIGTKRILNIVNQQINNSENNK